jgi:membrane-bound metal-dependent hydrolase YbcI (DUF457 family)
MKRLFIHKTFTFRQKAMPSPVGHLLSGISVYTILKPARPNRKWIFFAALFMAVMPDFDFVFGFFAGNPNRYHHHFTHSIFFITVMSFFVALFFSKNSRMSLFADFVLLTAAGSSHLLLDMLAVDTTAPFGMPLFWPLSEKYIILPVSIFSNIQRASHSGRFLSSLFNLHNLVAIGKEVLILGSITLFWLYFKKREVPNLYNSQKVTNVRRTF